MFMSKVIFVSTTAVLLSYLLKLILIHLLITVFIMLSSLFLLLSFTIGYRRRLSDYLCTYQSVCTIPGSFGIPYGRLQRRRSKGFKDACQVISH